MGPGRQFLEDVAQIREGLDVIELAGLDQGIDGRRPLTAGIIAREEEILPADSHAPEGALDRIMPTPGLCRVPLHKGPLHAF